MYYWCTVTFLARSQLDWRVVYRVFESHLCPSQHQLLEETTIKLGSDKRNPSTISKSLVVLINIHSRWSLGCNHHFDDSQITMITSQMHGCHPVLDLKRSNILYSNTYSIISYKANLVCWKAIWFRISCQKHSHHLLPPSIGGIHQCCEILVLQRWHGKTMTHLKTHDKSVFGIDEECHYNLSESAAADSKVVCML